MNIHSCFPSNYIKADLLHPGQEIVLEISDVKLEEIDDGVSKPVLYFVNKRAGMCLNRINANTLADAFGPETDGWLGRHVVLFRTMTEFQGRRVPCLRLRLPTQAKPEPPVPPSTDLGPTQPGDEIPF